jgi:ABC-type multidrug transport system fused ATPase/permease subunit
LIAFAFLILATVVELAFPFVTRIAIDDYIVKSGRKVGDRIMQDLPELSPGEYFITQAQLEKIDPMVLQRAEKEGILSKTRFYYARTADLTPKALELIGEHAQHFEIHKDLVIISYDDLKYVNPGAVLEIRKKDYSGLLRIALIFLGIMFLGSVVNFVQIYFSQYAGQMFMHSMRMKIFTKLQSLDLSFFDRNPVGRLVTRATNDVEAINEALVTVLVTLFRDIMILVGIVVIMFVINTRLALISFVTIPLIIVLTSYFRIRAREIYRVVRRKLAKLNATLQENLSGIRVIKIFSQEQQSRKGFDQTNTEYLQANLREVTLLSFFRPVIEIISSLGIGLVLYYGGGQAITGKISLGVLVAFIAYVEMFFRPIRELTESYTILQSAMASSERIFLLLDEKARIKDKKGAAEMTSTEGDIEFRNVYFSYDEPEKTDSEKEWVLKNVSFRVKPGEHVAIVGPTGAGKTSIISLISRLYEIQKGEILLDGKDIRETRLDDLRSRIGVVMQDVFLFAGDIKSNIRLNQPLADEKVKEIASYINADRFIDRFPNKYDEEVMERGVTLSTGERQLLSFARVLAFDPKILVLDEATANIDAETERLIQEGMQKLVAGRTSIIIAHRLSTVKEVDRIYVIHKGEIKEVGTHNELLKKKGIYYNLYKLQTLQ